MGPLGAVFLVGEGWKVAKLAEDFGQSGAFGYGCFGLDADFIARVSGWIFLIIGDALVGDGAEGAILADAE